MGWLLSATCREHHVGVISRNHRFADMLARYKTAHFFTIAVLEGQYKNNTLVRFAQPVRRDDATCKSSWLSVQSSSQVLFDGFLRDLPILDYYRGNDLSDPAPVKDDSEGLKILLRIIQ